MAERVRTSDDDILYENDWVEELNRLAYKADGKDFFVRYRSPAMYLCATGFQLQADARRIHILLLRQSPEGSANALLEIYPSEEDLCQYHKLTNDKGEVYLAIAFPACPEQHFRDVPAIVAFEISTDPEFLGLAGIDAPVQ